MNFETLKCSINSIIFIMPTSTMSTMFIVSRLYNFKFSEVSI